MLRFRMPVPDGALLVPVVALLAVVAVASGGVVAALNKGRGKNNSPRPDT